MSDMNAQDTRMNRQLRAFVVWDTISRSGEVLTIAQVAKRCNMARSRYLKQLLTWLVDNGFLSEGAIRTPSGKWATCYGAAKEPTLEDLWVWAIDGH